MIKKYAIKVPFPDEDSWVFVTRDPHASETVEFPGEMPLLLFEVLEEAVQFAKTCNGVVITMTQRDGWWEQDEQE